MKPVGDMAIGELAAFVCSHLKSRGIKTVLSGGACISIYTANRYESLIGGIFNACGRHCLSPKAGKSIWKKYLDGQIMRECQRNSRAFRPNLWRLFREG